MAIKELVALFTTIEKGGYTASEKLLLLSAIAYVILFYLAFKKNVWNPLISPSVINILGVIFSIVLYAVNNRYFPVGSYAEGLSISKFIAFQSFAAVVIMFYSHFIRKEVFRFRERLRSDAAPAVQEAE